MKQTSRRFNRSNAKLIVGEYINNVPMLILYWTPINVSIQAMTNFIKASQDVDEKRKNNKQYH